MLVKCPKCGFDQPKDTYCASCGIEMDSFKPIKPPLWKSIIKNPLVPLLVFVGLGYGAYFYLKNPSQFEFPRTSTNMINGNNGFQNNGTPSTNATPISTPSPTPTTNASPSPSPTAPPGNAPQPSQLSVNLPEQSITKADSIPSTPEKPIISKDDFEKEANSKSDLTSARQDSPPIESITGPLTVEIRFVEAPTSIIQNFLSEASDNSAGDSGEMSYAIVKNSSAWINHKSFKELDRFTKNVPDIKKKLQWFSGTHDPAASGAPFGLDFQISIQERVGGHLGGDLFISRSIVEHLGTQFSTQRKEFTTHFETDVGSIIGLVGVMPRTRFKPEDKDLLQDSLLKIFLSSTFLEGESDLLILLQFKAEAKTSNTKTQ